MRNFHYNELTSRSWDNEVIGLVAQIHEYKGRQELYLKQKPAELDRLIEVAKVQSTEASNEIEGIRTTNTRLMQLVRDKTTPRNRDEEEIMGYRDVLNTIHENYEYIPITSNYICSCTVTCISIPIRALEELLKIPRTISVQQTLKDESLYCLHRLLPMKRLRQSMRSVRVITA